MEMDVAQPPSWKIQMATFRRPQKPYHRTKNEVDRMICCGYMARFMKWQPSWTPSWVLKMPMGENQYTRRILELHCTTWYRLMKNAENRLFPVIARFGQKTGLCHRTTTALFNGWRLTCLNTLFGLLKCDNTIYSFLLPCRCFQRPITFHNVLLGSAFQRQFQSSDNKKKNQLKSNSKQSMFPLDASPSAPASKSISKPNGPVTQAIPHTLIFIQF